MGGSGRVFIARHGETVFNAARRLQGEHVHTPLTRAGFAQADAMGMGLAAWLEDNRGRSIELRPIDLWASDTGRALQTLAIVAEHVGLDWHGARVDARLREIDVGEWSGRSYAEISAEGGPLLDPVHHLFTRAAPGGEWYDAIARRLESWLADIAAEPGDRLIIMHGISARVLRGLLTGIAVDSAWGAGIAPNLPQGSMVMIEDGRETLIHLGAGQGAA